MKHKGRGAIRIRFSREQRVYGLFSRDEGTSWNEHAIIADGAAENRSYWDVTMLPLANARLLAFFWTHDAKTDKELPIHQARSTDSGRTWSKPQSIGVEDQVCNFEEVGDGRVVMVYNRRYHEAPGIMAALSSDPEGLHWDSVRQTTVWDARAGAHLGPRSDDSRIADMNTWAFGYPCVLRLEKRKFPVTFRATEACVAHIRWCRLRLTAEHDGSQ